MQRLAGIPTQMAVGGSLLQWEEGAASQHRRTSCCKSQRSGQSWSLLKSPKVPETRSLLPGQQEHSLKD